MRKFVATGAAFAVLIAPLAFADAHSQIVQAKTHAGLAAKADALDGVQQHLHHALNCVVGPKGEGFDAKELNPCANAGNGAIPDSSNQAQKTALQKVVDVLNAGLSAKDMTAAKSDATKAAALLKAAE